MKPHNITIIQANAPVTDYQGEIMKFYEQLDNIIAKTPKKDVIIVQGD